MLTVGLVSDEYHFGATGLICADLALHLSNRGIKTTVFTGGASRSVEKLNDNLEIIRSPVVRLPPKYLWFQVQNCSYFKRNVTSFNVVHGVDPKSTFLLAYALGNVDKRFIVSFHGTPEGEVKRFWSLAPLHELTIGELRTALMGFSFGRAVVKSSLARSEHAIACCNFLYDEIRWFYRDARLPSFSVIYNAVDVDRIASVTPPADGSDDEQTMVFHGRFIWRKGVTYLLRAMEMVKEEFPDSRLKIYGWGGMKRKILGLVDRLRLGGCVEVVGLVGYKALIRAIKGSRFVVLPSVYEAQPLSALEAMACRKPVVAFDSPFAREYINSGENGLLAKPTDEYDLASKMIALLSDRSACEEMGHKAFERVNTSHNWKYQVEKYIRVYESVAA